MKQIKGLYKISRPMSTLSGALAVVLGGYVAGTGEWLNIFLATLATLLISAAANAWNDYMDIEIDKINQPQRPLPSGMVSPRAVLIFAVLAASLSLIIAAMISTAAFVIAFCSTFMLLIYSWRLKSTVLLGNATVAFISALSAVFGGVAAGNVIPSLWLAAIIFTAIMGREVLKTMADYEGDLRQKCRTISTVWGRRPARVVFFVLAGITLGMMMLPYLFRVYKPVYAYIVVLGVYPVIVYILVKVNRNRTGAQLERLSQLMKYDFLIWFVAVLLGAQVW
ncbi:MAG: geranylgeranylglycerol-phosphate geranylgeranyltransferase [Ardenticatenaceae bacterium]|nr:geranylgeranylglycerol-phosphate geranylgeranyltransferase [Anaerolineales bacterium]MCB8982302.1 geranylgeranylglycerol-phosphate geranylgeranyltransferase [Ardenticatenaceae bacterium]